MDEPKASVIICTYKREEALCLTIGDILGQDQDCPPFELIVVDQTPQHLPETEEFLRRNAVAGRLRWLRLETANLPNARNRGVAASSGEILVGIDDDVRIEPDFLGRLLAHLADERLAAVGPLVVDGRGREAALADYTRRYGRPSAAGGTGPLWPARDIIGACFAVQRKVFDAVGGFDARMGELHRSASGEDYDFFRRVSAQGHRISVDPTLEVLHVADTSGGCEVRTGAFEEALRAQLRANIYILRKEDRLNNRGWLWTWVRMMRRWLVRRDALREGPLGWGRRIMELRESIAFVRKFNDSDREHVRC